MRALPLKLRSLLRHLKELENSSAGEREKAAHRLAEMLDEEKLIIIANKGDTSDAAAAIGAARARLEDIHQRLDLTIKSGVISESIH